MAYSYDLAGDVTSWTHPASFTITNTISGAQRVTQLSSSLSDSTHPPTLAHNIHYTPWGALATLQNGCAGSGCTEALETYAYNNRLQVSQMELGKSGSPTADFTLGYNYTWPSGALNLPGCPLQSQPSANNGNVIGYTYTDAVNNYAMSHSALYVYDSVNRLACAQATSPNSNPTATYNLAFSYTADGSNGRYGNMTCVQNAQTNGTCPVLTFDASTNRINSANYAYDAAGNMTTNGSMNPVQTYQWDGEGRVASVNSGALWNFTYNALGQRVLWTYQHGTPTDAWYDPQGTSLGMAGQWSLVRFFGHWTLYIGSDTWFSHPNPLGSDTMRTDHGGIVLEDMTFYPWGDVWLRQGAAGFNFAGIPYYDQATDTSIAPARFYANNMGQWLSPDPLGQDASDPTDPQTWNMYAYARNNPTTLTDPDGDYYCDPDSATTDASGMMTVHGGACHYEWSDLPFVGLAAGHHYFPQQFFRDLPSASNLYQAAKAWVSGPLKDNSVNYFDQLHRASNKQIEGIVRKYLAEHPGAQLDRLSKEQVKELFDEVKNAGGKAAEFYERLKPEIEQSEREIGQALDTALQDIKPLLEEPPQIP